MLGGRTIATAQLGIIWGITRNPGYNYFGGDIRVDIESAKLPCEFMKTLCNKSEIDIRNPIWQKIFERVRKETQRYNMGHCEAISVPFEEYRNNKVQTLMKENHDHESSFAENGLYKFNFQIIEDPDMPD